jgi:hypothetical protein
MLPFTQSPTAGEPWQEGVPSSQMDCYYQRRTKAKSESQANTFKDSYDVTSTKIQVELWEVHLFLNVVCLHAGFQLSHHRPTCNSRQYANRNGKERLEKALERKSKMALRADC